MSAERWQAEGKGEARGRTMRGGRSLGAASLAMVGVILLVVGVLAGAIAGHMTAPAAAAPEVTGTQHLYLTVAFNPYTNLDEYFPANFTVTAGVPVIITITNYDNMTNAVPSSDTYVRGTVGGTANVTNATVGGAVVRSVPASQVGHTFTVDQGGYDINVPIPAAQGRTPTSITFTLVFSSAGAVPWHCMAECDGLAMNTPGFMTGTITVVSA